MRRYVGGLVVTLVLVLVVTFPGSASWPARVSAQPATPEPTPTSTPLLPGIPGIEDAVFRIFSVGGVRIVGTQWLTFELMQFSDDDAAQEGMRILQEHVFYSYGQHYDMSGVKRASSRTIGDETVAFAGAMTDLEGDDEGYIAIVLVRCDRYVDLMRGGALLGEPLVDVLDVGEKIINRDPVPAEKAVDDHGLRIDGLWDMLPRLDDLPEGFILDEEIVPEFDPAS